MAIALPPALRLAVTRTLAQKLPVAWQPRKQGRDVLLSNPAQSLTLIANPTGMSLKTVNGTLQMRLVSLGTQPLSAGVTRIQNARITTHYRQGLSAWYLNTSQGIEQGFTLERAPAKTQSQDLVLSLALSGSLKASQTKTGIVFSGTSGRPLQYGELVAYDQHGTRLPAKLQLEHQRLLLSVDTEGAVFPVTIDPLFSLITDIPDAGNTAGGDFFGNSVALSADGSTALIGAPISGTKEGGAAFVFTQTNGVWSATPQQTFSDPNGTSGDYFGSSVALSGDGNFALIGASGTADSAGQGRVGVAYLYTRSNGTWSAPQTIQDPNLAAGDSDGFGIAVAMSGTGSSASAIIGAPGAVSSAYLYSASNNFASPTATFTDSGNPGDQRFGQSVALSADGSVVVIGESALNSYMGQVYLEILRLGPGGVKFWTPTLIPDPNNSANDNFGTSVAISPDGTQILIGSSGTASYAGTVYLENASSGAWAVADTWTDPAATAGDEFGISVAWGGQSPLAAFSVGALLTTGAPQNGQGGPSAAGEAYFYVQNADGTWPNDAMLSLPDPGAAVDDQFGTSVALSGDGTIGLVGAPNTTSANGLISSAGEAYVISPTVDLALALSSNPASQLVGGNVTYELTVTNNETAPQLTSTNLTLTDALPAGMTFVSDTVSGGSCSGTTTVTCTLPSLAPQATWQPSITVTATTAGSIQDTATVLGNQPLPTPAHNTATTTTTVTAPQVALSLTYTGPNGITVNSGQSLVYALTVTNTDKTNPANNLTLTTTLVAGVSVVSDAAAGGSCTTSDSSVTCTLATLAAGATWTPSLTVSVSSSDAGQTVITDAATVKASNSNTASITASVTVASAPPPPPPPSGGGSSGGGGGSLAWLELLLLSGMAVARARGFNRKRA
ncbi:MAG: hypothetical protein ACRETQ_01040 [Gammaproteobacteria bacterium]